MSTKIQERAQNYIRNDYSTNTSISKLDSYGLCIETNKFVWLLKSHIQQHEYSDKNPSRTWQRIL